MNIIIAYRDNVLPLTVRYTFTTCRRNVQWILKLLIFCIYLVWPCRFFPPTSSGGAM